MFKNDKQAPPHTPQYERAAESKTAVFRKKGGKK